MTFIARSATSKTSLPTVSDRILECALYVFVTALALRQSTKSDSHNVTWYLFLVSSGAAEGDLYMEETECVRK